MKDSQFRSIKDQSTLIDADKKSKKKSTRIRKTHDEFEKSARIGKSKNCVKLKDANNKKSRVSHF